MSLPLAQEFKVKCELHPVTRDRNVQVAMKKQKSLECDFLYC